MAITVFQMNIWHCKGLNIVCTAVQKVEVTDFLCVFEKASYQTYSKTAIMWCNIAI